MGDAVRPHSFIYGLTANALGVEHVAVAKARPHPVPVPIGIQSQAPRLAAEVIHHFGLVGVDHHIHVAFKVQRVRKHLGLASCPWIIGVMYGRGGKASLDQLVEEIIGLYGLSGMDHLRRPVAPYAAQMLEVALLP